MNLFNLAVWGVISMAFLWLVGLIRDSERKNWKMQVVQIRIKEEVENAGFYIYIFMSKKLITKKQLHQQNKTSETGATNQHR